MKKSFKTIISVILALIMALSVMITPMAAKTTKDAVGGDVASMFDIQIDTNKSSYGVLGIATITVDVTNNSESTIYNVGAEAVINQLDPVGRNSDVYAEDSALEPGETLSFEFKATLDSDVMDLSGWNTFWLNFKRFWHGNCKSEAPDFDDGRACEIASKEMTFGSYDVEQFVKVWYESGVILTIDQSDYTTTDITATVTGSVQTDVGIDSITYTSTADADQGEPSTMGSAVLEGNLWTISFNLKTGLNKVVVTVKTVDNRTISKSINITYDIGEIPFPEENDYGTNEDGLTYRKGVLTIYFNDDVTDAEAKECISACGGTVIGQNNLLKMYQARFDCDDYDSLVLKQEEVSSKDIVQFVEIDELIDGSIYTVSDPWDGDVSNSDWYDGTVEGSNWGLEAIDIATAWEYNDRFASQPSRIGVVDTDFLMSHEDFAQSDDDIKWYRVQDNDILVSDHGTHVAGTIAAANNSRGITGIVQNTNMYVAEAGNSSGKLPRVKIVDGFVKAVVNGAKVVNFSLGSVIDDSDSARQGASKEIVKAMVSLLDRDFDFLCVQSAGNDAINARRNSLFCSIYEGMSLSFCTNRYTAQDLIDRIIVVGAVEKTDNGYELASFSNWGEKVNIVAPGVDIYSTRSNGGYGYKSGTSMAAPHVTAVAGLVWSINHEFTMKEVKEIICSYECTNVAYDYTRGTQYRMLNAGLAVKKAVALTDAHGTVYGTVVDAASGYSIESGSYKVHKGSATGEVIYSSVYSSGEISFSVPAGTYVIEVFADGDYVTQYMTVEVVADGTVYCGSIPVSKQLAENQLRIVMSWGANPYDLDSHINGYLNDGNSFHVAYYNRSCYYDGETAVWLDVDDTDSYGPETITIVNLDQVKNFKYSVHNYSGKHATSEESEAFDLSDSGAVISVYKGNSLVATYSVPTNRKGTVWDVFSVDENGRITTINSMYYQEDPRLVGVY